MAYSDEYRSAKDVLAADMEGQNKWTTLQEEARAAAEAAGVSRSEYVGYAEAFAEYEKRSDVEPLSERRAREAATSAADQDFVRSDDNIPVYFTSPRG